MNTQQQHFYSTGLAGQIIPHVVGKRSQGAPATLAEPYAEIDAGPWHVDVITAVEQTQAQLVSRLVKMAAELSSYIESLPRGGWKDYQEKTVARCCDLMEYEHGYCLPETVELLELHHGINPTAETGPVSGRYAEFSLTEWEGREIQ